MTELDETAHTPLDERGLEAAYETLGMPDHPDQRRPIEPAIRAYLQTAAADVSGLVAELRDHREPWGMHDDLREVDVCLEAASTLQTLSASNAALEAELAEAKELVEFWKASSEASDEYIANMRAKLAVIHACRATKGGQDHG